MKNLRIEWHCAKSWDFGRLGLVRCPIPARYRLTVRNSNGTLVASFPSCWLHARDHRGAEKVRL